MYFMKKTTIAMILILFCNLGRASCPQAEVGFTAGCVKVEENHKNPNGKKINLFYQVFGQFDHSKKTIVFVNGGPGDDQTAHSDVNVYHNLSDQFNVIFYDQRGIGKSIPLINEQFEQSLYLSDSNVEDLAVLIDEVAGGKAFLFGHSYGGYLAYAFSAKYSDKLYGAMILSGYLDYQLAKDAVLARRELQANLFKSYDQNRLQALFKLIQEGKAELMHPNDLDWGHFMGLFSFYTSTFQGQSVILPQIMNVLFAKNKAAIDAYITSHPVDVLLKKYLENKGNTFKFGEEISNEFFYLNIMCHENLNPLVAANFDQTIASSILDFYNQSCQEIVVPELLSVGDLKPNMQNATAPLLIIGASHDVNVPLVTQRRDYDYLSTIKNNVHFVTLQNSAHIAFEDSPKCLEQSIRDFTNLIDISKNRVWTCQDPE